VRVGTVVVALLAGLLGVAGCKGGDASECDALTVTVTVYDPSNVATADATVTIDGEDCPSNGDGTYTCTAALTGDRHQVSAIETSYTAVAKFVEEPEDCGTPVDVELVLQGMMGA
jgi:hypothetical protein